MTRAIDPAQDVVHAWLLGRMAEFGRRWGGVAMLRYAIDMLLLARDARLLERGMNEVRGVLARGFQALRGRPEVWPLERGVDWLG